ncbi:hypothetical protein BC831DRAFT_515605 [Entophlyctis helioformis]|nr:hypothetical protein BC831DRAFT_515605 [Entophlyctis helioformis]
MAQIDEHSLLALRLHRSVGAYRESPDMIEALGWPAMATRIKTRCRNVPGFAPTGGEYLSDHVAVTHLVSNLDKVDIRQFAADLIPLSISSHFNEDIAGKSGELASVIQSFAQVGFNSITIDSICRDTDEPMVAGYMAMKKQNVGSGIYATASLLNHSCDPNTHMYFTNSHLHVRTTRLVRKGEAVTTSYLQDLREKAGKQHSAVGGALTAAALPARPQMTSLNGASWALFATAANTRYCPLTSGAPSAARLLTGMASILLKAGGLHDSLAAMYAHVGVLNGREDVWLPKAVTLLGKSIQAVERAFGSTSPQSAYEQLKLAHLTAIVSCKQAIDAFGHCIRMFETLFGPDAPELADLKGAMAAQQRAAGSAFSPLDLAHDAARAQAAAFACLARPPTAASC